MTRFVHLTDLHLSHPEMNDPHLFSDTVATLRQVVGMIAGLEPAPDFVAISGDLTNHGDAESYRVLHAVLEGLPVPVILALGNHDRRAGFREVFGEMFGEMFGSGAGDPEAPVLAEARHGDLHVLALDSSVAGRVGGAFGPDQAAWLEAALRGHPGCRKLILCHHPPHAGRAGALAWESLPAGDSARLGHVLAGHDVAGILSGHVHLDRVLHWQGIPVVISTGLHNGVDPLAPRDMVIEEAAGFAVCDLLACGLEVTFVPVRPARRRLGTIGYERLRGFS